MGNTKHAALILFLLLGTSLGGCLPMDFDELRDDAPIFAFEPQLGAGVRGFGRVLTTYEVEHDGRMFTRLAINAGSDSSFLVVPVAKDDELDRSIPVLDGCTETALCDPGAGVSLFGIPAFGTRRGCVGTVSPETGQIQLRCEDDVTLITNLAGEAGVRFGFSTTALPPGQDLGVALIGAPGANSNAGGLYRLTNGMGHREIDLSAALGSSGELGRSVAAAELGANRIVFAAGAPIGATQRVIVATADTTTSADMPDLEVIACLDQSSVGFGEVLAFGDINGDGSPELVVGSRADAEGRSDDVRIFEVNALPGSCADATPIHRFGCSDHSLVECGSDSGFGGALAVADLNDDGMGELVVAARRATVGGVSNAGALYVFAGHSDITALNTNTHVLHHSNPQDGAELGTAVAIAPGVQNGGSRRMEIAAGAPGSDRAYLFLCSGVDGDTWTQDNPLCQP